MSGCQEKQTVNLNNTIDSVPLDHIIPLTKLVPRLSGTACILYPYQDRLPDEAPDSTIINRYLADIQFNGNESHRSEERREGKECVSTCKSGRSTYHQK